ncbi:hypothetical protein FMEAI12_5440003 [Parafrankia sp. Ea1.12]|nr:hypothetical protein FMEAI12_5440003 [Parafrankia sp. Ea1.12]
MSGSGECEVLDHLAVAGARQRDDLLDGAGVIGGQGDVGGGDRDSRRDHRTAGLSPTALVCADNLRQRRPVARRTGPSRRDRGRPAAESFGRRHQRRIGRSDDDEQLRWSLYVTDRHSGESLDDHDPYATCVDSTRTAVGAGKADADRHRRGDGNGRRTAPPGKRERTPGGTAEEAESAAWSGPPGLARPLATLAGDVS